MADLSDFLFNGTPPPSVTTYGTTTPNVPQWLSDFQQGLYNKANTVDSVGYQPYVKPDQQAMDNLSAARIAPFSDATQQSWQTGENAVNAPTDWMNTAWGDVNAGGQPVGTQASQPYLTAAGNGPSATGAASPYMAKAAQGFNTDGALSSYMSPYTDEVASRMADLSNRNFNENLLPSVNDTFIKNGQFGGTNHEDFTARALRDNNESLQGALGQMYNNAYSTAGGLFGADQSRTAGLAQTAGNQATADTTSLMNLGTTSGNMAANDASRALTAAGTAGTLGTTDQTNQIRGASIQGGIGAQQEGKQQQLLDTSYQDFQNQVKYPQDQLANMSAIVRGINPPTGGTTTTTAPASSYAASPFAQILGAGLTGYSLLNGAGSTATHAKGGQVRRERTLPKGALSMGYRSKANAPRPRGGALAMAA